MDRIPINGIASQGIGIEGIIIGLGIFPVQTLLGQSQQMGGILFCLTLLPQVAEGKAQGSQQQTASQDHTDPFPEGIIPAERFMVLPPSEQAQAEQDHTAGTEKAHCTPVLTGIGKFRIRGRSRMVVPGSGS